jgi:zinc protease
MAGWIWGIQPRLRSMRQIEQRAKTPAFKGPTGHEGECMTVAKKSTALLIATLAILSAASSSLTAQQPGIPTIDQIIDHYERAVGGRASWQRLKSRSSMGTVEVPSANLSGTVVIHEKAPDKILTIIIISGSAFRQGFDGKVGWAQDLQEGLREQSGAELAEARRQSDFYGPFDLHQRYAKLISLGAERVDDREAYAVEATLPEGGEPDKFYFDKQSGLPIRLLSHHHTPEGVAEFQEDFSDYKGVDGVILPFTVSQRGAGSSFTVRISEVRHNIEFEDSEFSKPDVQ